MDTNNTDLINQNRVFLYIALMTGLLLTIPLVAMRFTDEVRWTLGDFAAMGALVFTASSLFVLVSRSISKKYRLVVAVATLLLFLWLWAELAVGIFTNWGS